MLPDLKMKFSVRISTRVKDDINDDETNWHEYVSFDIEVNQIMVYSAGIETAIRVTNEYIESNKDIFVELLSKLYGKEDLEFEDLEFKKEVRPIRWR